MKSFTLFFLLLTSVIATEDRDWEKILKITHKLKETAQTKDSSSFDEHLYELFRAIPSDRVMYYIGLIFGPNTELSIGSTSHYIEDNSMNLRLNQIRQSGETGHYLSEDLSGLIYLYTGKDEIFSFQHISSRNYRLIPTDKFPAYSADDVVNLTRHFNSSMIYEDFTKDYSQLVSNNMNYPIVIPNSKADIREMARYKNAKLVLADYNKKTRTFMVKFSATLSLIDGEVLLMATKGSSQNCIHCATEDMKSFLSKMTR